MKKFIFTFIILPLFLQADETDCLDALESARPFTRLTDEQKEERNRIDNQVVEFTFAVVNGEYDRMNQMIEEGFDPNTTAYFSGQNALHRLATPGRTNDVMILLGLEQVNPNELTKYNRQTALISTIIGKQSVTAIAMLDRSDVDENISDILGQTPLMHAAKNELVGVIIALSRRDGLKVNAQDNGKKTALIHAVLSGDLPTVEALLERRDIDPNIIGYGGVPSWMLAIYERKPIIAKKILEHPNIDPEIKNLPRYNELLFVLGYRQILLAKLILHEEQIFHKMEHIKNCAIENAIELCKAVPRRAGFLKDRVTQLIEYIKDGLKEAKHRDRDYRD